MCSSSVSSSLPGVCGACVGLLVASCRVAWVVRYECSLRGDDGFLWPWLRAQHWAQGVLLCPFSSSGGGKPYSFAEEISPALDHFVETQKIPLLGFPMRWVLLTGKRRRAVNPRGRARPRDMPAAPVTEDWQQSHCRRGARCRGRK